MSVSIFPFCIFTLFIFQRKHALRAYSQALQIYKGKGWALAEVGRFLIIYIHCRLASYDKTKHIQSDDCRNNIIYRSLKRKMLYLGKVLLLLKIITDKWFALI